MTKTVGHFAQLRSHGCFAYLERELFESPDTCRALLECLVEGLGLPPAEVKISTKDYHLQWSKFAWSKVEAALAKPALAITLLVGTPSEVHLGARLGVRLDPRFFGAKATRLRSSGWSQRPSAGRPRSPSRARATPPSSGC